MGGCVGVCLGCGCGCMAVCGCVCPVYLYMQILLNMLQGAHWTIPLDDCIL